MGAYLSEPVTEKLSTDETSESVQCGASCMQGWRINQEDAHNTIMDFDTNTMLFAVYDGHGGAEVAAYCSQKLPDFIKNTEAYKNNDITKALEDAFLSFDALIATKEVMEELKEIAGQMNPPADENEVSSEEEENMSTLYQDAALPLPEVLAKYKGDRLNAVRNKLSDGVPLSPCLRGKKDSPNFDEAAGSSSGAGSSNATDSSDAANSSAAGSTSVAPEGLGDAVSSAVGATLATTDDVSSTSTSGNHNKDLNGEVSTSEAEGSSTKGGVKDAALAPDSSADMAEEPQQSGAAAPECNGDVSEGKSEEGGISSSNGETAKGKAKAKAGVTSSEEVLKKSIPRRVAADMFKKLLMGVPCDDDDSDSNDETFEGREESDEEHVNGAESSDEDEEGSEEGSGDEEEEDSSDDEFCGGPGGIEEPGSDSGCTAVVALLRGNVLYVGNAGDSRCIVCREGVAVDMSIDHKPEDQPELERIVKAGGKVSQDGRINGGLNLSRAIGDHAYKQNKELNAKEQMITALPDVRTLTVDPERDEFMLLACDGIWNFMSSQDVCDFIRPRLKEGREKLSQICEEMFDHCLAPNTVGDGTGCDNMTAILVTFRKNPLGGVDIASATTVESNKRTADGGDQHTPDAKRQKVDDSCSAVTSSV